MEKVGERRLLSSHNSADVGTGAVVPSPARLLLSQLRLQHDQKLVKEQKINE